MIKNLKLLVDRYLWAVPCLTALGLVSSLFEGLGIALFVPFLNTLTGNTTTTTGSPYLDFLNSALLSVPLYRRIWLIGGLIFLCVVLKNVFLYGSNRLGGWVNAKVMHRLRTQIHDKIISVSMGYLDKEEPGRLINLISSQSVRAALALSSLNTMLYTGSYTVAFSCLLFLTSRKLSMFVGVLLMMVSFSIRSLQKLAVRYGQEISKNQADVAGMLNEAIGGAREIRGFAREEYERNRFERASEKTVWAGYAIERINAAVPPISEILSTAVLCVTVFIAVPLFSTQYVGDLPKVLAFVVLLYRVQPQWKGFEAARVSFAGLSPALQEIAEFVQQPAEMKTGPIRFEKLKTEIRLENVSFAYDAGTDMVLSDVSFDIKAGCTTAIVGASGAGKSTVANLLARFYDPASGQLTVDGTPLSQLDLHSWRSQLGIVSQHVFLFNDTIRNNIAYGKLDATDEEIVAAARMANAHDFILDLPDGYASEVGDRGLRLSGGQRQRVALARAILRQPEVFILDEATSSLDNLSEQLIQEALSALSHDHTIVVIAHRLTTVEKADRLVVLERGRVVEQGEPSTLLQSEGFYARLHNVQPATPSRA